MPNSSVCMLCLIQCYKHINTCCTHLLINGFHWGAYHNNCLWIQQYNIGIVIYQTLWTHITAYGQQTYRAIIHTARIDSQLKASHSSIYSKRAIACFVIEEYSYSHKSVYQLGNCLLINNTPLTSIEAVHLLTYKSPLWTRLHLLTFWYQWHKNHISECSCCWSRC